MSMLAYATSIEPFLNDSVLEESVASHFPGASVWPAASYAARIRGWDFSTGDVVLERIRRGELRATDVKVIQEEDAALGTELIQAGAQASLLLCGESPLFAQDFYRNLRQTSRRFDNVLLFRGALAKADPTVRGHALHFPSFHRGSLVPTQPWGERGNVVMVAGNKYWRHAGVPFRERLARMWTDLTDRGHKEWIGQHQLHDRRLSYVVDLFEAGLLTLYGPGWGSGAHLPREWRHALTRAGVRGQMLDYASKQSTVGGFKFALTLENFQYPGYVTEKVVDALAAGAIPLYLGAPDIHDFIPSEAFVDLRQFPTTGELVEFLRGVDAQSGMAMIEKGQRFLSSAAGDVFTYEFQGEYIVSLATAQGV